jgi:hypothetical protein
MYTQICRILEYVPSNWVGTYHCFRGTWYLRLLLLETGGTRFLQNVTVSLIFSFIITSNHMSFIFSLALQPPMVLASAFPVS